MRSPEPSPLAPAHRELLLDLARASIRSGLARAVPLEVDLDALPPDLHELVGALRQTVARFEWDQLEAWLSYPHT